MAIKKFEQSAESLAASQALNDYLANQPQAYQSAYQPQIDSMRDQVLNREKFTYDFNADPLYQQYKTQYTQQGKQAMRDTTARAAALSGGFGNSYGATAGNQAYQAYLSQLNAVIPELSRNAYSRYQDEGNQMRDNLAILQQQEASDYGRYQDALNAYNANRDYLAGRADTLYNRDYGAYQDQANLDYKTERDKIADEQWAAELAYQRERDKIADEQWQKEFNLAASKSSGGSGGGGRSGGGGSSSSSSAAYSDEVRSAQILLNSFGGYNLEVDGKKGSKTTAAIKQFQKESGLKQTGNLNADTIAALQKRNAYVQNQKDRMNNYVSKNI